MAKIADLRILEINIRQISDGFPLVQVTYQLYDKDGLPVGGPGPAPQTWLGKGLSFEGAKKLLCTTENRLRQALRLGGKGEKVIKEGLGEPEQPNLIGLGGRAPT